MRGEEQVVVAVGVEVRCHHGAEVRRLRDHRGPLEPAGRRPVVAHEGCGEADQQLREAVAVEVGSGGHVARSGGLADGYGGGEGTALVLEPGELAVGRQQHIEVAVVVEVGCGHVQGVLVGERGRRAPGGAVVLQPQRLAAGADEVEVAVAVEVAEEHLPGVQQLDQAHGRREAAPHVVVEHEGVVAVVRRDEVEVAVAVEVGDGQVLHFGDVGHQHGGGPEAAAAEAGAPAHGSRRGGPHDHVVEAIAVDVGHREPPCVGHAAVDEVGRSEVQRALLGVPDQPVPHGHHEIEPAIAINVVHDEVTGVDGLWVDDLHGAQLAPDVLEPRHPAVA